MHFTKIIVTKYAVQGTTFFPQGEYDGIEVHIQDNILTNFLEDQLYSIIMIIIDYILADRLTVDC